jgi:hypothetical protein
VNPRTKFCTDVLVVNCIVRGSFFNRLTVFTSKGARAQPAIFDANGEIVAAGEPVGHEFWNAVVLSARRYWKRLGILKAYKTAPHYLGPPPELYEWDEPGDPNDPVIGSLANATIDARHELGNEAISVAMRGGAPATFAVVGEGGRPIEMGSDVAWAAWLVCTRAWARCWFDTPIRPVFATPWGCFEEWFGYGRNEIPADEEATEEITSILELTEQLDTQACWERNEARKAHEREQRKLAKSKRLPRPPPRYLPHGEAGGLISMDEVDRYDLVRLRGDTPFARGASPNTR